MTKNELFLKTAFCCMACDGNIVSDEIEQMRSFVRDRLTNETDADKYINEYLDDIRSSPAEFISSYLRELKSLELNDSESLNVINLAIQIIESDNEIAYAEVKFFKQIRACLKVSDDVILNSRPELEDYLLPDIISNEIDWNSVIRDIKLENLDIDSIV